MEKNGLIFMLDDDVLFLNLYKNLFEAQGYRVFATDNAYKFLQYARELPADIFLMDINMPDMNGWEVLQRLEKGGQVEAAPVVMMTVVADRDLAFAKGVAHFLNKPVNLDLLYEILEVYVRGGKKHDVLLIEDYNPLQNGLGEKLKEKRHSVFIVHDPRAAKNYLRKNKARAVLVHKDNDEFVSLRPQLDNEKVFRVENENNLVDIEKVIS